MTRHPCPACGEEGRSVKEITLRSLVEESTTRELDTLVDFFFCACKSCDVAYFAADGRTVDKQRVTVRIGVKENESPRPLCFCFDVTAEDIEDEVKRDGATTIPDMITERCREGLDRCPETNPRGSCCLGDVRRFAKAAGGKSPDEALPACCSNSGPDE